MTPVSTYRLQLNRDFDLAAAEALVSYLQRLGVDWLYLSPIFAAQAGSPHGYDVIDPTRVNPELGGRRALESLSEHAHAAGLHILVDIVPNHEAASAENLRWQAALASHEPGWFDVDWVDGEPRHRRFFDVDGLVGIRVEDEDVYRASHALVFELLQRGIVDGLRVDHVDGLADPAEYLERLRRDAAGAFTVVEKILARDETLRAWPVDGTTGYEAGDALTALCIDPDGRRRLEAALLGENGNEPFGSVERESKTYVFDNVFQPEWRRVVELLGERTLVHPLRALTIALDVYRTYGDTYEDRLRFDRAAAALDPADAAALEKLLVTHSHAELPTRWRQLSGPVMAKGREDTASYRYPALLAQNEVGSDPGERVRDAPTRFDKLARGYRGLIATSTHDSKRSEDVRARICVLSERPAHFEAGFDQWCELVEPDRGVSRAELRFVAQTLLGAWPLQLDEAPSFASRIADYLTKALREAKQATNWISPDERHENAVIDCARRTIANAGSVLYDAFGTLVDDVMFFGALNSLSMLTWKLGMPGTPDIYRGSELWDLSLVDPDNRRPVDFDARERCLDLLEYRGPDELLRDWRSGAVKMQVTASGLRARRRHRDLFVRGAYVPLDAPSGIFAFARQLGDAWAVAIAPRLSTRVTTHGHWPIGSETWGDAAITLPDAAHTEIRLADALQALPVALLVRT